MRGSGILFVMLLLPAGLVPWSTMHDSDEAAVRETINHYFEGHRTGNGEHFKQAFHPESKLFWVHDGALQQRTSAEYIARASGSPPEDDEQRIRRIESIDITGDAAVVKLVLDYPSAYITDYMTLLEIDGRWWIVNKAFTVEPKADPGGTG
jgi:hypothetical protein